MKAILHSICEFIKTHKKQILLSILAILILLGISIGAYFILQTLGITNVDKLQETIQSTGAWGWLVFILLQVIITTVLCVMPGTTMIFMVVGLAIFGPWRAMIIVSIGVFLSSMLMFFIGDKCGEKVAIKIVGKEAMEKAQKAMDVKTKVLLPLMLMLPAFPDDALCMVAGMTKMKYWQFAIIVIIFRSIGVISFCLAGKAASFIDYTNFTLFDWILLGNIALIDIYFIIKIIKTIEKKVLSIQEKALKNKTDEVE